jgi:U2 small nuclear ribonucleoprotein B''
MSEPTTSLKATVADESEEIAAEASSSVKPEEVKEEVKEEKVDPNALPEDACVTLYLQNLNEKVKIPGQFRFLLLVSVPSRACCRG